MSALRDRCKKFYQSLSQDAILRQGSPVDAIVEFVQSEVGRKADPRLERSQALVLYFADDRDREEFLEVVRQVKPGMVMRKVP